MASDVGKSEGTQQYMSGEVPVHEGAGGGCRIMVVGLGSGWKTSFQKTGCSGLQGTAVGVPVQILWEPQPHPTAGSTELYEAQGAHSYTMAGPGKQNAKIVISPSGFKAHFMDHSSQKGPMKEGSKIVDTGKCSLYCNTPLESCHLKIPGCLPGRKSEYIMSLSNSVPFLHSNIYSHYALVNVDPSFTNEETDIQNVNYS